MEKQENPQPTSNEQVINNPQTNPSFSGILQAILAEELANITYWVIQAVKQRLQSKPADEEVDPLENAGLKAMPALEELMVKVASLIERLDQRNQAMVALESRIIAVETLTEKDSNPSEQAHQFTQVMTAVDNRIASGEKLLDSVDNLAEKLGQVSNNMTKVEKRIFNVEKSQESIDCLVAQLNQVSQNMTALENRIAKVESLLARFSVVPKLIDRQSQAIASLQSRIATLEGSQDTNHKNNSNSRPIAKVSQTDVDCCRNLQSSN